MALRKLLSLWTTEFENLGAYGKFSSLLNFANQVFITSLL